LQNVPEELIFANLEASDNTKSYLSPDEQSPQYQSNQDSIIESADSSDHEERQEPGTPTLNKEAPLSPRID